MDWTAEESVFDPQPGGGYLCIVCNVKTTSVDPFRDLATGQKPEVVPVHAMKAYGEWRYNVTRFYHGITCRSVVSSGYGEVTP